MCMFSRSREWYATDMRDLWRESGVSLYWRYARTVVSEFSSASLEEEAENLIQEQSEDDQGWVWLP